MGVNAQDIFLTTSFPAEHSWVSDNFIWNYLIIPFPVVRESLTSSVVNMLQPTEDRGGPCDQVNSDQAYLSLCGYETAYELLAFLYDDHPVVVRDLDFAF